MATLGLTCSAASAQLTPNGGELQVNTYTTSFQQRPAVAADAAGNFVVAWQSFGSGGVDNHGLSVQAQRFDAGGAPAGGQFEVNTYTSSDQHYPAVAADAGGSFVVTWRSFGSFGSDTQGDSVQGQLFDAAGAPSGAQFQVNSYTTDDQRRSAVAVDGFGNAVVVWGSNGSPGTDSSLESILSQRYDAAGNPLADELQVNSYTSSHQVRPDVVADAAGNFVVVWQSDGSAGTDTSDYSIQAQRFDADGDPVGGEFQVNVFTTNGQRSPAVAVDGQGNFVVVWGSLGSGGTDTSDSSIQARRYGSNGFPLGGDFQVNTYTAGFQRYPAVAADAAGNFVVAWQGPGANGTDTSGYAIQAQHFAADGTPLGGEIQVNTYTTNSQELAAVTADGQGHFVVAWQSLGSGGTDSDTWSIQAQRFDATFFGDGFETGNTGRWSGTVP